MAADPRHAAETAIHCAIVELLQLKAHRDLIWFHPANGEERPVLIAAKLQRMGVVSGVSDLAFTLPNGRSAYMEVKSERGKQSPRQIAFQSRCRAIGVPYEIVRSVDDAESVLACWGALREMRRAA